MKTKSILLVILAVLLLGGIFACDGDKGEEAAPPLPPPSEIVTPIEGGTAVPPQTAPTEPSTVTSSQVVQTEGGATAPAGDRGTIAPPAESGVAVLPTGGTVAPPAKSGVAVLPTGGTITSPAPLAPTAGDQSMPIASLLTPTAGELAGPCITSDTDAKTCAHEGLQCIEEDNLCVPSVYGITISFPTAKNGVPAKISEIPIAINATVDTNIINVEKMMFVFFQNNTPFAYGEVSNGSGGIWSYNWGNCPCEKTANYDDVMAIATNANKDVVGSSTNKQTPFNVEITTFSDFSSNETSIPTSIQQTGDGGYIIAGTSFHENAFKAFVRKLKSDGSEEWPAKYYDDVSGTVYSIKQTTDGGYIVAGTTYDSGFLKAKFLIFKLDEKGTAVWNYKLSDVDNDLIAYSVQETKDGGYIAVGSQNSGGGNLKAKVVKLEKNGDLQWDKSYDNMNIAYSVVEKNDSAENSQYIAAGYKTINNDKQLMLMKIDSNGLFVWEKPYGGSGDDVATSIQNTNDGGLIAAGYSNSKDIPNPMNPHDPNSYTDAWILKLDSNENTQWHTFMGGNYGDYATSIQQTKDGGYIAAGIFSYDDTGGSKVWVFGSTYSELWVFKLDSNGTKDWERFHSGLFNNQAFSIQQTKDSGYIVAGTKQVSTDGGITKQDRAWILKLNCKGNLQ